MSRTAWLRMVSALLSCAVLATAGLGAPAPAGGKIGVVLMHGEGGAPGRVIARLGTALETAGYVVQRPDMCWSARRSYEATFTDCLATIDDAIVQLKKLGASEIGVAGFSLGGNAAIAYGATHGGLLGVVAIAPAHDAIAEAARPDIADGIARARVLIAQGRADEQSSFDDVAIGPSGPLTTEIATTARIYLSFFGLASPAVIADNVAKLGAPLLWIAGSEDPTQTPGQEGAFSRAPANATSRYVSVGSSHLGTADAAVEPMLAWMKDLAAR